MSKPTDPFCLTSDHIPVCFPFPPSPPSSGIRNVRFAFVVRLEAQNSTAWRKGPYSPTARTLYKRDTTLLKTLEGNVNDPRKRAFVRCGDFGHRLLPRPCSSRLFCRDRRWNLLLLIWGRDLFYLRLTRLHELSSPRLICFNAWPCSINNL